MGKRVQRRRAQRRLAEERQQHSRQLEAERSEDVAIHPDEGNRQRLALPIQGLTARLGTVLVVYAPPG